VALARITSGEVTPERKMNLRTHIDTAGISSFKCETYPLGCETAAFIAPFAALLRSVAIFARCRESNGERPEVFTSSLWLRSVSLAPLLA
jgi:hypothetical protein